MGGRATGRDENDDEWLSALAASGTDAGGSDVTTTGCCMLAVELRVS